MLLCRYFSASCLRLHSHQRTTLSSVGINNAFNPCQLYDVFAFVKTLNCNNQWLIFRAWICEFSTFFQRRRSEMGLYEEWFHTKFRVPYTAVIGRFRWNIWKLSRKTNSKTNYGVSFNTLKGHVIHLSACHWLTGFRYSIFYMCAKTYILIFKCLWDMNISGRFMSFFQTERTIGTFRLLRYTPSPVLIKIGHKREWISPIVQILFLRGRHVFLRKAKYIHI